MSEVFTKRMTAELDGDFVVFLLGMQVHKLWKVHKWLPLRQAMLRMLKELRSHPELGFLGCIMAPNFMIQYWRSFDHLEAYARKKEHEHLLAWQAFNQRLGNAQGDVGIWHETYLVRAGEYESIYSGMPKFGLGSVGRLIPATGRREAARGRLMI